MFHSLIPLKNMQIFKGNAICNKKKSLKEWLIDPCLMYKKIFFLDDLFWACFDHSSLNQMQTCHQTCTFYHTFPIKGEQSESLFYSYNNYIGYCLLHKMLKKTNIITIITCIVNMTYTISYCPPLQGGAGLQERGGGLPISGL